MPIMPRRRASDSGSGSEFPLQRRSWYFEKRISLDTIVGIVGIAVVLGGPFIIWGRAMEGRILSIEVRDEARSKSFEQITTALDRLSAQMTTTQIQLGILTKTLPAAGEHK